MVFKKFLLFFSRRFFSRLHESGGCLHDCRTACRLFFVAELVHVFVRIGKQVSRDKVFLHLRHRIAHAVGKLVNDGYRVILSVMP